MILGLREHLLMLLASKELAVLSLNLKPSRLNWSSSSTVRENVTMTVYRHAADTDRTDVRRVVYGICLCQSERRRHGAHEILHIGGS
jgi:hypothetical protein